MSKFVPKPLSHKRLVEIAKAYEEMDNRLLVKSWQNSPSQDWATRLAALFVFQPQFSCRKVLYLAKINSKED